MHTWLQAGRRHSYHCSRTRARLAAVSRAPLFGRLAALSFVLTVSQW